MGKAQFQFHRQLNDFLPNHKKNITLAHSLEGITTVKDAIESFDIPHTEVDIILVNGKSVDFTYQVMSGDKIQVFPAHETPDVSPIIHLQPARLKVPRFVLDTHLGKLAAFLRMLGFDSLYKNDFSDEDLASISNQENRYLLTRDRGVLKRNLVTHGYYLRSTDPQKQLAEVLNQLNLYQEISPFKRCIRCNGLLHQVSKSMIRDRLPLDTMNYYDEFHLCSDCDQVYWKGSHYQRMQQFIAQVLQSVNIV